MRQELDTTPAGLVKDRLREYDLLISGYSYLTPVQKLAELLADIDRETITLDELDLLALRAMQGD